MSKTVHKNSSVPRNLFLVSVAKRRFGWLSLKSLVRLISTWQVTCSSPQVWSHTSVPSTLSSEMNLPLSGSKVVKLKRFPTLAHSVFSMCWVIQSRSETGLFRDFQVTLSLSKTLSSLLRPKDGHSLSIHKAKPTSGSEPWVKKRA